MKSDGERYKDRLQVIEWAREVLADPSTVVLDLETASFHDTALPDDDPAKYDVEICEIGIVSARGEVVYDLLVGPAGEITEQSTAVHGISPSMVADAAEFADRAFHDLSALLPGRRVVAYNASFDRGVLRRAVAGCDAGNRSGHDTAERWMSQARWEDVMLPYSRWIGEWDADRNDYRWQRQPGAGHRAIADCYTTLGLLHAMAKADPSWQPPAPGPRRRPASRPASDKQVRFVNDLLSRSGASRRADRLALLSQIVGRQITSSKELTGREASDVIDRLKNGGPSSA